MTETIKKFFTLLWRSLNFIRSLLSNLLFFIGILLFLAVFAQVGKILNEKPSLPDSAALVLNLNGNLVEQKRSIRLMEQMNKSLLGNDEATEIELSELLNAIEYAAQDKAISALILDLQQLSNSSLSKLKEIGEAIVRFKKSQKPVIAIGDSYSQEQYYLASFADTLYLNPAGSVLINGFGRYQLYMKTALEKLKITPHVFRVGDYKSAVEPFILDGMSPQAKADAQRWLDKLWQNYVADVALQRDISSNIVAPDLAQFQQRFTIANGNQAQYALQTGLVDQLVTRPELLERLQALVGKAKNGESYAQIAYQDYISLIPKPYTKHVSPSVFDDENLDSIGHSSKSATELAAPLTSTATDKIALITAAGTIVDGEQAAGNIGGDTLAGQLMQARLNKSIKAVVLRIDSPGGSAFASEIIRNEVQAIQAQGKPVVVSMGSYAASGGYWIAADADKIFATSTTITGSIGIFGLFPTFEKALAYLGISTDGVRTGPLAGVGISQALPEHVAKAIQMSVESGYRQFINLVAKGRNMTPEAVDKIAQGRIWTGEEALEIGLIDALGDLNDAIASAAELANISDYQVLPIKESLTPQEQFLMELFGQALADTQLQQDNPLRVFTEHLQKEVSQFSTFNDPQGRYALCPICQ